MAFSLSLNDRQRYWRDPEYRLARINDARIYRGAAPINSLDEMGDPKRGRVVAQRGADGRFVEPPNFHPAASANNPPVLLANCPRFRTGGRNKELPMLITKSRHEREMREAFGAGWRTNAVGEDAQPASYLDSCEQGDFEEYRRLGLPLYLGALAADEPSEPPIDWEAKFKKAITDLAAAREEIDGLNAALGAEALTIAGLHNEIEGWKSAGQDLQADALAHRARLKRDREQKAAKRAAKAPAKGVARG